MGRRQTRGEKKIEKEKCEERGRKGKKRILLIVDCYLA